MLVVKFNVVEEFCQEMEKDVASIDRGIVRVTKVFEMSKMSPNIHHVSVLATYSVEGQVVRLEHYCGNTWHINEAFDQQVLDKAEDFHNTIAETCQRLKLEVRAGSLTE